MIRKKVLPANHGWWKGKCHIKTGYASESNARRTGRTSIRENGSGVSRLWPYACPGCRLWHLTKQDNGEVAITAREMWEGTGL